ncbi:globin domain-containing protein [Corynebacterium uropygiale]|uniref:nitric oxide dioxygenase n=1 Tax=Corynebacterium uropygiale TaxID=1775911 RepID=A0A9X1QT73_9CORY|nr:globin domain-containing protein [Corynebacterium uropygiale]MCF4007318.1 globin domain-containing protein [Corynebacterium uropygiale]
MTHPLTPEQEQIVRDTLPVVGAKIDDITPNFYRRMFAAHPELIAHVFNRGNQKQGAQQRALAASFATFAKTLVDPEAPDPAELLARIGHKHVSVGIREDQYPIVHTHLFDAIEEILTPEVFQGPVREAWDAVYREMERVLVDFENGIYEEKGVASGDVFRTVRVTRKQRLTDTITAFTVASDADFRPGQYISVRRTMADGAGQLRQYSLIGAPGRGELSFAVERDGEVSQSLIDGLEEGQDVEISLPTGDLVLDEERDTPVVLVSAGIGATPMAGILQHLADAGSPRAVLDLHADHSEETDALRELRAEAVKRLPHGAARTWYAPERLHLRDVDLPEDADVYLCGGTGFLQAARAELEERGVPRARVHFELFGPNDWLLD